MLQAVRIFTGGSGVFLCHVQSIFLHTFKAEYGASSSLYRPRTGFVGRTIRKHLFGLNQSKTFTFAMNSALTIMVQVESTAKVSPIYQSSL